VNTAAALDGNLGTYVLDEHKRETTFYDCDNFKTIIRIDKLFPPPRRS